MNYDEVKILAEAFNALPENFKNNKTHFAIMQGRCFIANANYPPHYFDNNAWHKVPVVFDDNFSVVGH